MGGRIRIKWEIYREARIEGERGGAERGRESIREGWREKYWEREREGGRMRAIKREGVRNH